MKSSFLFLVLITQMAHSQYSDPNKEVKKLIKLGKDHIIELALEKLRKQETLEIKKDDFHFITVKASNQRILVNFGYNVLYLPKNSSYYSDIIVELPSKFISKSTESNNGQTTTLYHPTPEHLRVINFIMNPSGNNPDIFHKGIPYSPTIIYEKENNYLVDFSARDPYLGGGFSKEEIDKETGEVLSTLSGHYARIPDDMLPRTLTGEKMEREEFIEIQ